MDFFYFALIILVLAGIIFLLNRVEKGIKSRFKKSAYALLETDRPDPKEVRDTIRGLHLYGGRLFKDKECVQLVDRLLMKHGSFLR
ncbi:MAG: hypothetical protein A2Y92_05190 [Chloroflexi bacterium RBG_13_57_8]|nr:MAG: hypothetical protein A2Y92_05190 [Chloroflexi bacterium RBG_13_57_8]